MFDQLLVVHVYVHVKPEAVERLPQRHPRERRDSSRKEPGVVRFDLCPGPEDPTRFVLVEVYRGDGGRGGPQGDRALPAWRDAVAPMMAEPRSSRKFASLFPDAEGW